LETRRFDVVLSETDLPDGMRTVWSPRWSGRTPVCSSAWPWRIAIGGCPPLPRGGSAGEHPRGDQQSLLGCYQRFCSNRQRQRLRLHRHRRGRGERSARKGAFCGCAGQVPTLAWQPRWRKFLRSAN